ncbi:methyltransferase [Micromonospora sp. CA-240977]|uniref:methyltransferase n=1 Tax=Micromonospora sp. CA-240977 TaxID=3239957 RepID=UPI003D93C12B
MTAAAEPAVRIEPETRAQLIRLTYGYMASRMIHTAVRLGLPDLLDGVARDSVELAERIGAHAPSLHRLLRALAGLGLLAETEPGRFRLATLGAPLSRRAEHRTTALTELFLSAEFWDSWQNLEHSIRTGRAAFDNVHGRPFFAYLDEHPALLEVFNEAMAENARFEAPRFVSGYDFGRYPELLDVGGGNGALLHAILAAHPDSRGIIFETPTVAEQARAATVTAGLAERCRVIEGDFFVGVPAQADAVLLKSVMHNWDDERCVTILRNCRPAIRPGGRLLLLEPVLPTPMQSQTCVESVLSDINMLALTAGGFERTEDTFRRILDAAGYTLGAISATIAATDFRVIEAEPI